MEMDRLFLAYLTVEDESAAAESLERLFRHHLMPWINRLVKARLVVRAYGKRKSKAIQDLEDITNDVVYRLMRQFRRLRRTPSDEMQHNLAGYVRVATATACNDYLRNEYPEHYHFREEVRLAIKRHAGFALWTTADKRLVCGPAGLEGRNGKVGSQSDLERTRAAIESIDPATLASMTTQAERLQYLLEVIFEPLKTPIEFNDLVCLITTVLPAGGLTMPATGTIESLDELQHPGLGPDASLDESTRIKNIWQGIAQLPVDQRRALLLNFRDGHGANMVALFLQATGAKPAELMDLLAMPGEQFEGIFNRLPLQDAEIAALFGRSRREIIALRQAAHRRLDRRRKGCSNPRGKKAEQRNRPNEKFFAAHGYICEISTLYIHEQSTDVGISDFESASSTASVGQGEPRYVLE